ncbi:MULTISPECIES: dipicolinate synthase subunit B [unclassified Dehalobacter]|uniref:dipicolinate synthase subunit B n=1 Tax=unclassified Dehalobacter TaxID=2635733 RepID=UPI00037D5900|nr:MULTISPECIES: dipicolinate synthase subunit B [unclassified Dehalobacter]RJE49119.1 dipicolinate synthase subunit B [Dehalobacter sp. MCB1]TCX47187.1 dipicolinate synthase subunit B [Dehalobacter sp. 14DCB1]TCX55353.1 dipicolinate synthase subunit B [Dehalobacter sp. 12DCB1]
MRFEKLHIGFALTGSHCTLGQVMGVIRQLVEEGADITPIVSESVNTVDTRFGEAAYWKARLKEITGKDPIRTIPEAEPIGPGKFFDCMVIAPCTGNTLAKLANGITDTPVLMATKAHLRNLGPVVIAISTNDGLGVNAKNIGALLLAKNIYLVPFGQDSPLKKTNSLVAQMNKIPDTILMACQGKQIEPLLVEITSSE